MSFSTCSAGALPGPDFCFIFAPGDYDEPSLREGPQFVSQVLTANKLGQPWPSLWPWATWPARADSCRRWRRGINSKQARGRWDQVP